MSYRIASFNIQDFGKESAFETSPKVKDLDTIAKIVRENNIDIIAIQEISHKLALKSLLEKISQQYATEEQLKRGSISYDNLTRYDRTNESFGYRTKHWEGRWASPVSAHGNNAAEGYAFIWNRDRIKLVTNYKNEIFEPRIETFDKNGTLVRPPFIGRFMPVNGRSEFRLINTHIAWGTTAKMKKEEEELFEPNIADVEMRKREFLSLIESVYIKLAQKQYDVNRNDRDARPLDSYTFLLGDYNLNLHTSKTSRFKLPVELQCFNYGKMKIITVNSKLTTLKGIPTDPQKAELLRNDPVTEHHLANNYDHFSYDAHKLINPETDVIYAFNYYENIESSEESKYDLYRRKISDHIPIYIDIDLRKRS